MEEKLKSYVGTIKNLPPSPSLMIELVKLLNSPDRDIDQLVELLRYDQAVTAEILKLCNSAFFGQDEPATDVFEATFRLGFYEVYRVAMALSSSRTVRCPAARYGVDLEALWAHSALTALTAQKLAKEVRANESVAFTVGILHDIGKVVFGCGEGTTYGRFNRELDGKISALEAERARFGFDHGQLGSFLLGQWQLPDEIVIPVEFHHTPELAPNLQKQTAVITLADVMAHRLNQNAASRRRIPNPPSAMEILQIDSEAVTALTLEAKEEMGRVQGLFQRPS
ncbi:MAG: HDOD domain-containing protein [Verrucomicrobiota bacterium]